MVLCYYLFNDVIVMFRPTYLFVYKLFVLGLIGGGEPRDGPDHSVWDGRAASGGHQTPHTVRVQGR